METGPILVLSDADRPNTLNMAYIRPCTHTAAPWLNIPASTPTSTMSFD